MKERKKEKEIKKGASNPGGRLKVRTGSHIQKMWGDQLEQKGNFGGSKEMVLSAEGRTK